MTSAELFFAVILGIQIAYWAEVYFLFPKAVTKGARIIRDDDALPTLPALSVVIAARNEEFTIGSLLESLSSQNYPSFEIIVVDDHSTDATVRIVSSHSAQDARIRVMASEGDGKKRAIETGIRAARYDVCVFTDADCRPEQEWLLHHGCLHARSEDLVVVGYAPLETGSGFGGTLQRYETDINAMFSAASIEAGRAFLATGRNLSYTKSLFERVGKFDRHLNALSGDDDLFLQDVRSQTSAEIIWVSEPDATVHSSGKKSFSAWMKQKRRHGHAGKFYVADTKWRLALYHLSQLVVWSSPLFIGAEGVVLIFVMLLMQGFLLNEARIALGSHFSLIALPALAFLNFVHMILLPASAMLVQPKSWGGRTT